MSRVFFVDLWAEKHDRLVSKDARKICQEISDATELIFGSKKTVDKCQHKIKHLIEKCKDASKVMQSKAKWRSCKEVGTDFSKTIFKLKILFTSLI